MKVFASIADLAEGKELSEEEFRKRVRELSDENANHVWLTDTHPFEGGARRFLNHVEECARVSLLPPGSNCLPDAEVEEIKYALEHLRPCFEQLTKWFIDPLRETRPDQCDFGYEKLWGLIGSAFLIGVHATVTEGAKNYFTPLVVAERMKAHTANANLGRRKTGIQTIIDRHSAALWRKKPKLRQNRNQTAKEIRDVVFAEIEREYGENLPHGWARADEKVEVGRIRKRIRSGSKADE